MRGFFLPVLSALLFFPAACGAMMLTNAGIRDNIVGPRILSPSGEEVTLALEEPLEVKWSRHESVDTGSSFYDLRIYKGAQRVAPALIYKERFPRETSTAMVQGELFEDGEIYTLALRRVYRRIGNSEWSICTFRIRKTGK